MVVVFIPVGACWFTSKGTGWTILYLEAGSGGLVHLTLDYASSHGCLCNVHAYAGWAHWREFLLGKECVIVGRWRNWDGDAVWGRKLTTGEGHGVSGEEQCGLSCWRYIGRSHPMPRKGSVYLVPTQVHCVKEI